MCYFCVAKPQGNAFLSMHHCAVKCKIKIMSVKLVSEDVNVGNLISVRN